MVSNGKGDSDRKGGGPGGGGGGVGIGGNDSTLSILQPYLVAIEGCGSDGGMNVSVVRSIVLKVLSEWDVFYGYDEVRSRMLSAAAASGSGGAAGGTEWDKLIQTLELFSYGTYLDYERDPARYVSLTETQANKLRQLTALSIVQDACKNRLLTSSSQSPQQMQPQAPLLQRQQQKGMGIPYSVFGEALRLTDDRQIEEVLISCLYSGVVTGAQLCQKSKCLLLSSTNSNPRNNRTHASSTSTASSAAANNVAQQQQQQQQQMTSAVICPRDVKITQDIDAMMEMVRVVQGRIQKSSESLQHSVDVLEENKTEYLQFLARSAQQEQGGGGGGGGGGSKNDGRGGGGGIMDRVGGILGANGALAFGSGFAGGVGSASASRVQDDDDYDDAMDVDRPSVGNTSRQTPSSTSRRQKRTRGGQAAAQGDETFGTSVEGGDASGDAAPPGSRFM